MNAGFYSSSVELARSEAVLGEYRDFLIARNGAGFVAREARMAGEFDATRAPSVLQLDAERFNRNYASLRERALSKEELALLAFVKINAGEAWGVECVSKAREQQQEAPGVISDVERLVTREEHFHTRLLVGAAGHFHGPDGKRLEVTGAWKPGLPLRVIIGALVHAPRALFHPVLLGAEVAGVFAFNWLLTRLRDLFPDAPSVRESMERRLVEVLIDEVGHIAFNRVLVGAAGRAVARTVAKQISWSHQLGSPELVSLGFGMDVLGRLDTFDLGDLPDEVRRRAFFA
ncbi:MAG: hypothetical protein JNM17_34490 [Archangium sp.]|nr:hypothetical protein [Archangium sp.]